MTKVFPVPGGPCMSENEEFIAIFMASSWIEFGGRLLSGQVRATSELETVNE